MLTEYNGDKAGFVISPNLVAAVEKSGNVVLRTPERVITITNVDHLIEVLKAAKAIRDDNFEAYTVSTVTPTYQAENVVTFPDAPTWGPWGKDGRPGA